MRILHSLVLGALATPSLAQSANYVEVSAAVERGLRAAHAGGAMRCTKRVVPLTQTEQAFFGGTNWWNAPEFEPWTWTRGADGTLCWEHGGGAIELESGREVSAGSFPLGLTGQRMQRSSQQLVDSEFLNWLKQGEWEQSTQPAGGSYWTRRRTPHPPPVGEFDVEVELEWEERRSAEAFLEFGPDGSLRSLDFELLFETDIPWNALNGGFGGGIRAVNRSGPEFQGEVLVHYAYDFHMDADGQTAVAWDEIGRLDAQQEPPSWRAARPRVELDAEPEAQLSALLEQLWSPGSAWRASGRVELELPESVRLGLLALRTSGWFAEAGYVDPARMDALEFELGRLAGGEAVHRIAAAGQATSGGAHFLSWVERSAAAEGPPASNLLLRSDLASLLGQTEPGGFELSPRRVRSESTPEGVRLRARLDEDAFRTAPLRDYEDNTLPRRAELVCEIDAEGGVSTLELVVERRSLLRGRSIDVAGKQVFDSSAGGNLARMRHRIKLQFEEGAFSPELVRALRLDAALAP